MKLHGCTESHIAWDLRGEAVTSGQHWVEEQEV